MNPNKPLISLRKDELPLLPPVPWGRYRHYKKSEHLYEVVGLALHTETLDVTVIYKRVGPASELGEGVLWSRPYSMFMGTVEYEGKTTKRFIKVGE
jgi:hypothetical protein